MLNIWTIRKAPDDPGGHLVKRSRNMHPAPEQFIIKDLDVARQWVHESARTLGIEPSQLFPIPYEDPAVVECWGGESKGPWYLAIWDWLRLVGPSRKPRRHWTGT